MNRIACITDSDEFRYPEEAAEKESPLTLVEQQIVWLCDDWKDALKEDSYEAWHLLRMEIYGATQTLNAIGSLALRGVDPREELCLLGDVAFQHCRDCITAGKYEGAPA